MLDVVDELERNGHNLQHFSRELARYFRNLLVIRISGAASRLVAASARQREKLAEIAAGFSEEDLTRYLQLSLDLFRDLQYSLQPRFHLEIGLVRLVQAGRLLPIEEALAQLGGSSPRPAMEQRPAQPAAAPAKSAAPPQRTAPSPLDLDRAKKATARPPEPQSSGANALAPEPASAPMTAGDTRERLHSYLHEKGLTHLADAVENARITVTGADLQVVSAKSYALYFRDRGFEEAVRECFGRPLRVRFEIGDTAPASAPAPASALPAAVTEDQTTSRALSHPEVQRFREVFPAGEIRKVRNLKES
jgi:DNA polymerase-3 subunit gamma/tau